MKKFSLYFALSAGTLLGLTAESQAQFYTPYAYNNNAYMNYAMASQKARATRSKARVSKRSRRSRSARSVGRTHRKTHRYSRASSRR